MIKENFEKKKNIFLTFLNYYKFFVYGGALHPRAKSPLPITMVVSYTRSRINLASAYLAVFESWFHKARTVRTADRGRIPTLISALLV